jgi:hypothetical protein
LLEALRAWNPDELPAAAVYTRERPLRQVIPRRPSGPVNGHAGNEAYGHPPLPAAAPILPPVTPADDLPRFVIHLPVAVRDLDAAKQYARQLCASLAHLPEIDAEQVTVSYEDSQHEHHRVFCGLPMQGGVPCFCEHGHPGACGVSDD